MSLVLNEFFKPTETESPVKSKRFLAKGWGTRHTMVLWSFFGFVLFYAMRFNLSLAIVPMVQSLTPLTDLKDNSSDSLSTKRQSVCRHSDVSRNQTIDTVSTMGNLSRPSLLIDDSDLKEGLRFNWTEQEQGLIMGSFFWGYVVTQYPGGRLSHRYGAKWIIALGIFSTGILSLIIPIVTVTWGKTGLIVIRVLQGLSGGVTFPSMHVMLANWSPPEERSRLSNLAFSGIPFGTAITMLLGGHLIHFFAWPSLFYVTGTLSLVWFIGWSYFVFNDPSEHPRISETELQYIQTSIQGQTVQEDLPTPWKNILKSLPVWSILIVHIGHTWGHYLMHTETPKYLHAVHNFEIQHNGWFSALPQLLNFAMGIFISHLSDFLIVKQLGTILFTRKMCTTITLWGSAAAFLGVVFGGCDTIIAVTCLNIGGAVMGAAMGGWIINNVDIAPNHAGTIMGVANSISNILGFIVPYATGHILHSYPSLMGWKIAFMIPAVLNIIICVFYLMFASTDEQPWNRSIEQNQLGIRNDADKSN